MKDLTQRKALLLAFVVSTLSLCAIFGSTVLVRAITRQSGTVESRNVNDQTVMEGRRIFVQHCVECHGFDAWGEEGSDLHNLRAGDRLIRQIITGGIKGEMPAYGKALNDADVRALVGYLRTLRN
ncbi:MAG: cytochrome c [Verrucomicrobia bacterium]|nr:cytochrome c [Verrucomicrobiota bacterium]